VVSQNLWWARWREDHQRGPPWYPKQAIMPRARLVTQWHLKAAWAQYLRRGSEGAGERWVARCRRGEGVGRERLGGRGEGVTQLHLKAAGAQYLRGGREGLVGGSGLGAVGET
jgi:hypothetical protein